jgi:hypothetical protein
MTEVEWLDCSNSPLMLELLQGQVSDRKLRLFACACARKMVALLTDPRSLSAITVAEQFADGHASIEALDAAWSGAEAARVAAQQSARDLRESTGETAWDARAVAWAAQAAAAAASRAAWLAAKSAATAGDAEAATRAARAVLDDDWIQTAAIEPNLQACLAREIFGNPFRPVPINPFWLNANDGAVIMAARAIADSNSFANLPQLADLLEQADCHHEDLLTHCRQPDGHVRGCWAIDALLGRT